MSSLFPTKKKEKVPALCSVLLSTYHVEFIFYAIIDKKIPISISKDTAVSLFTGLNAGIISSHKLSWVYVTHTHLCEEALDDFPMCLYNALYLLYYSIY